MEADLISTQNTTLMSTLQTSPLENARLVSEWQVADSDKLNIMSVKVGVRVRPFNQRETDMNCKLCVDMIGNMTRLFDADDPDAGKHRDYTFDYSFWSHDEFQVDQRGYFIPTSQKYADQRHVFEQVGIEILNNAWLGYHCCLFAYGQTGAGKSYSMVGYGANKGIVPISCEEIFNRIAANDDKTREYEVMVSMMEIYNEKVQDLLIPIAKRPPEGHKIREHKTLGIYVEGMSKHFVDTYDSIEKKMEEGGRNRSVAATAMNASSSRAHTIISIEFKQTVVEGGKKREKLSVIHLVDLAGSQKVGKTGATGDRLKEAAGINKSLSVLGLVISALADKATGKGKNVIVPYRDSCLTRILQNALGGNSKTLMICAISPATDNYDQTLSTLRYADQAKKIQNKAVVNESETDKLIRTLTEEREELRLKVQKMEEMLTKFNMGNISPDMLEQLKEAKEQQRYVNETIADREATKEDKKKHEQQEESNYAAKIDTSQPHMSNLNEDPQLSRKINYSLTQPLNHIGRRNITPPNHIEIGGMGIRPLHANIRAAPAKPTHIQTEPTQHPAEQTTEQSAQKPTQKNQEQVTTYWICPEGSFGEESNCYLNGDQIVKEQRLYHLDRVSFGTNNMFLVLLPGQAVREEVDEKKIDWEFAQNQLYLKKSQLEKQAMEEREKKMREEAEALLLEKEKLLRELENSLKESENQKKKSAEQFQKEKIEIERRIREQREQQAKKLKEEIQKKKERLREGIKTDSQNKEKYYFERKLLKTLPKCIELNLIAKEFKKSLTMSVKMMLSDLDEDDENVELKKRSIMVKVVNKDSGYCYWWDPDTLSNRYYIIKDMSEQYFQTGVIPILNDKEDPFWDPPAPALIGRCFLTTKALTYMFDNPATLPMIGEDEQCGELLVNLVPTDQTGTKNLCQEMDEEEVEFQPEDMLEKPFHFLIIIERAVVPLHYRDIYVEYTFKTNQFHKQPFKTKIVQQNTTVPVFDYKKIHSFPCITEPLLKYLSQSKLIFKVYGIELVQIDKKRETPKPKEVTQPTKTETTATPVSIDKSTPRTQKKTASTAQTNAVTAKPAVGKKGPTDSSTAGKKNETLKHGTSKANNKINERDMNNPKDKDCEIY